MFERPELGERTILADFSLGVPHAEADFEEFMGLAKSAGAEICTTLTGRFRERHAKFFIGSGQAEHLAQIVSDHQAELAIFNHDLSPSQERNLEALLRCRVLDRTGLILDIFASRAQSYEGKLQVELAQLEHLSTRLVRGWTHLERQKGGIGLRGPGETQLEMDKRLLKDRIEFIKSRLQKVKSQREQNRRARQKKETPVIALVGYTNAGKSTLFNALTDAETYVADQLFATLDPCLRRVMLPDLGEVIMVDTVGFIRALPHELVDAFRSTLEETVQADLLLHVVDISDPEKTRYIEAVQTVLKSIGAERVPTVFVYNKIDQCEALPVGVKRDAANRPSQVYVSAQQRLGIDELKLAIVECCQGAFETHTMILTPTESALRARLHTMQVVEAEFFDEAGNCHMTLSLSAAAYAALQNRPNQ